MRARAASARARRARQKQIHQPSNDIIMNTVQPVIRVILLQMYVYML
jgi:hypothetical protein